MVEYSGWSLYDNVILVIKNSEYKKTEYKQGYIVDPKNKSQLNSAIKCGRCTKVKLNEQGKTYKDENGYTVMESIEPQILELENRDFNIKIIESAKSSCQGGKLSFWNCLITRDNLSFIVGIDANLLLSLIQQSKLNNGECNKKVMFARQAGGLGLIHTEMKEYKIALEDKQTKSNISKGKTSKWEIGCSYDTLTCSNIYLGKICKTI